MGFLFEKLDVYQKGRIFVNQVLSVCREFPRGNAFLTDQLRRASTSILLNIAEGNGRWHKKERFDFSSIARGSGFECTAILQLCLDNKLIAETAYNRLMADLEEICKMLSGLLRSSH